MRVAMISLHTSPLALLGSQDAGGLNVYVRALSRQLGRRDYQIDIFTRRTQATTPEVVPLARNVRVIHLAAGPAAPVHKHHLFQYLPAFAEALIDFAAREEIWYDLLHSHYWLSGWAAHLVRQRRWAPMVHMFHTLGHMKNMVARDEDERELDLRIQIERDLMQVTDSLVAANPSDRAHMVWYYNADPGKICTVPLGVDLSLFQPASTADARAELGIGPAPLILFVGRIEALKGIDTLLEALALLRAQWPAGAAAPRLLIIGGELRPDERPAGELGRLVALRDELELGDHVDFIGAQPQEQLPSYYAAADVVAMPSLYESFGLVAVEAMACGTPVVASRVGGLAYTVQDGISGLLVPERDAAVLAAALGRVLSDPDLRARLGRGAATVAQRFSWPSVADMVEQIYANLVEVEGTRTTPCGDYVYGG
jgi:D-inositol-3-phosphate glycosyltransferase